MKVSLRSCLLLKARTRVTQPARLQKWLTQGRSSMMGTLLWGHCLILYLLLIESWKILRSVEEVVKLIKANVGGQTKAYEFFEVLNVEPFQRPDSSEGVPCSAQCAFCKVRCHCIFYGPGIGYSGIFCVPCISSGYSDIFWHISVVDTVAYFGGNHGSRVWKSLKLKKVYFPRTRTSWDKYMLNRIVFFQI